MMKEEEELQFCAGMLEHYIDRIAELRETIARIKAGELTPRKQPDAEKLELEHGFFERRPTEQVEISKPFGGHPEYLRYVSLRIDADHTDQIMDVFSMEAKDVHIVSRTRSGQIEAKALVYSDREGIKTLTLQKWDHRRTPPVKEGLTLSGPELTQLMIFLVSSFYLQFEADSATRHMLGQLNDALERIAKGEEQARPDLTETFQEYMDRKKALREG